MGENEAGVGDPSEQFHRNEAISAVADEGFLGVEEDDDYEDLYNDVNVGENFLQSLRENDNVPGQKNRETQGNTPELNRPPPPPPVPQQRPPVGSVGAAALPDDGDSSRAPGNVEGYHNMGFVGSSSAGDVGVGRGAGPSVGVVGGGRFRVELAQPSNQVGNLEEPAILAVPNNQQMIHHQQPHTVNMGNLGSVGNPNGTVYGVEGDGGVLGEGTILFVGDLHWWTTDAELETELCNYGHVKEVKFFDERASGKSKGYCQVEFYDPSAAASCKEAMNGHVFNGRPCVVAYASPFTVKRMGEAQVNRNQQQMNQPRRDMPGKPIGVGNNMSTVGNLDNNGRGFGRGNWGRGNNQGGMGNRGQMGAMRNRGGGMGVRGLGGNGFGQGIGAVPPMMGQGFDPGFGGRMMGQGYGGFPAPPFSGMLPSFGLPGVAPHVNPAFFGRGMPMNGMGMMPNPGDPNMGMWPDPNMGMWQGDDHGGRGESSYGEDAAASEHHQHGEGSQERGTRPNIAVKEKEQGDRTGSSERRHKEDRGYERDSNREKDNDWSERRNREDKDVGRDRQRERDRDRERERSIDRERGRGRHKDDRDRYADHRRHRSRDAEYDDEGDRGRSSRSHGRSRASHDEGRRSRSRDADYEKRRH